MTPRLRAALENKMSHWPTSTEKGRSIPGAEQMRRISVLSSFNWSLFWTTQTLMSEMQASMVRERVKASEGESDFYSSVSSTNIWWETEWWLITSERGWVYRMKRIGPKTEPWGTPQVRSEGEDFIPFTVTTCVLSVFVIRSCFCCCFFLFFVCCNLQFRFNESELSVYLPEWFFPSIYQVIFI